MYILVNDKIKMYKKCNIKMHNIVHFLLYFQYKKWRYNMEDLNKLKQELMIMKTENIKPNYSELARLHKCDRRTVKKYDNGYEGKSKNRIKESKLDKYREDIKIKLSLPGSTIKGTYEYFKEQDADIGNYSNFYKYSKDFKKDKTNNKFHPRYETEYGKQLQFDWKEDIKMFNKHGEVFEFNIFSSTLGASRLHIFIYSKNKTRLDVELRNEKAIYGCVRTAGFPFLKTFEDFDFSFQPTINKEQIIDFKNLRFIENNENIIFVGSPGVGKTHLATSIGIEAAQNRNSTYFINCSDLIANLKKAQSENRFMNRLNHYARYKLLIIDEVGFLPMDLDGANMLFQLINKRYEKHSTIITTNKAFGKWHEIFNDVTLANAILDRLLHHSHIININGNSYRLKDKLKLDSDMSESMHISE